MINEDALWYKRGDFVEFDLKLGGGPKRCRGLVVNTAVLFGRGARQIWIVDMDDATPEQQKVWTNRKHIIHEEDILSRMSSVLIVGDTILRDNPICYPVHDGTDGFREIPAVTVTIAVPSLLTQDDEHRKGA